MHNILRLLLFGLVYVLGRNAVARAHSLDQRTLQHFRSGLVEPLDFRLLVRATWFDLVLPRGLPTAATAPSSDQGHAAARSGHPLRYHPLPT